MDKHHCKDCKELKSRLEAGKYNDKDKKYVDETGKAWNGRRCPSCHQKKMKEFMELKRKLG